MRNGKHRPGGSAYGDSIVVAPIMTLTDEEHKKLNDSAIKIIRELKIEGGCNVQFALEPVNRKILPYRSKPESFPLVGAGVQGQRLPYSQSYGKDRRGNDFRRDRDRRNYGCLRTCIDYVVTKAPRFPFDKFTRRLICWEPR